MTAGKRLGNIMGFGGVEREGLERCRSRDAALSVTHFDVLARNSSKYNQNPKG